MASTSSKRIGELVARGTRSSIHAYGRGAVVKVPHSSTPAAWIESEALYADAAFGVGAPVPRLLGVEQIAGRPASVWERVEGPLMWERVVAQPHLSAEIGRMLLEVQLSLFELVPPVTLPRQHDRLASKIRRATAMVDPALIRALDLVPDSAGRQRLCHGDLHPSNVILSARGPIVVDWFDASRGDPVADVARTFVTLLGDGTMAPLHLPGCDRRTLGALTEEYVASAHAALSIEDSVLARWQAVEAVARIAEGVPHAGLLEIWRQFDEADERQGLQAAS